MKIVIASDSFKGNLRSSQICEIVADAIQSVAPDAHLVSLPMADGGEGTTEALVNAWKGSLHTVQVTGPLGRPVHAVYGRSADGITAVMDMASASGLELLRRDELNPLRTSTLGTGELLKAVLDGGVRDVIVGVGGSATVDGGTGMAQALGVVFLDHSGKPINRMEGGHLINIGGVDASNIHPGLRDARVRVACDVTNPLLGHRGAARVFGPQKGATPEMVHILEQGLKNLYTVMSKTSTDLADSPGDGAAGGLGFGLRTFCGAQIVSGAQLVAEAVELEKHLNGADLVITGEGCTDDQTLSGKLCRVVAELGRKHGVPVVVFSGRVEGNLENISDCFDGVFSIAAGPSSLDECLENVETNLAFTTRSVIKLLRAGKSQ